MECKYEYDFEIGYHGAVYNLTNSWNVNEGNGQLFRIKTIVYNLTNSWNVDKLYTIWFVNLL